MRTIAPILLALASGAHSAHAGATLPEPDDILITAQDEDGFHNIFLLRTSVQSVLPLLPTESSPPFTLPPVVRMGPFGGAVTAYIPSTGEIARYFLTTGGVEGGITDTPAILGALGFETFDNPIIAFEDPLFGFEDPLFGFEDPSAGYSAGYIRFNHPLIADDPSFDGFEDPLFGFEDPLFGFEDPLFGFTADTATLAYPSTDDAFEFALVGPPIDQAFPYGRAGFIDPDEIPAGAAAPLFDRLAGIIALSTSGRAQGLYQATFSTQAITDRELALTPLYTAGVFADPSISITGMHVDPLIPGNAILIGEEAPLGRGAATSFVLMLDANDGVELQRFDAPQGWAITDLTARDQTLVTIESSTTSSDARIVAINRASGARAVLYNAGQGFINPTSIAFAIQAPREYTFFNTADGTSTSNLRGAIIEANASGIPAELYLADATYNLSITGYGEDAGFTGDLDILGDIRIKGQGIGQTIINANDIDRVFDIHPGASLVLESLTVTGGETGTFDGSGANIRANGNLILIDCDIVAGQSLAGWNGGGIHTTSNLYAVRTAIRGNTAQTNGGGLNASNANITLDRCRILANSTQSNGGGIAFFGGTDATLINTSIFANSAENAGAGFSTSGSPTINIYSSTITRNNTATPQLPGENRAGGFTLAPGATVNIASSVVADNLNDGQPLDITGLTVVGTPSLNLLGYNFFGTPANSTFTFAGDTTATTFGGDPQLQPVLLNLFTLLGYQPSPTSPLLDAGNPLAFPATDQLGSPRPANFTGTPAPLPDIGAFERQPLPCPADVTGDRAVDLADLNLMLANFGGSTTTGDTNGDNTVDLADLNAILASFGKPCP